MFDQLDTLVPISIFIEKYGAEMVLIEKLSLNISKNLSTALDFLLTALSGSAVTSTNNDLRNG